MLKLIFELEIDKEPEFPPSFIRISPTDVNTKYDTTNVILKLFLQVTFVL